MTRSIKAELSPAPPAPKTGSRSVADVSQGTHVLEIRDYSLRRRVLCAGQWLRSAVFHVGGYAWVIRFYPNGDDVEADSAEHVAVVLELKTRGAAVAASYDMALVDVLTGKRWYGTSRESEWADFDTGSAGRFASWHLSRFMQRSELEASPCLRDDRLVIECTLAVHTVRSTAVVPPPSDSPAEHLGRRLRLEDVQGADVIFDVKGEKIPAHSTLVMARIPIFDGVFQQISKDQQGMYRLASGGSMEPDVFRAMIYFIYTDSLPAMDDLGKDGRVRMAGRLLIAAHVYRVEGMKMLCAQILSRSLDVETLPTTLVLADQCNCAALKDDCIRLMISSGMDDVMGTKGYYYASVKRNGPLLFLKRALRKMANLCKT